MNNQKKMMNKKEEGYSKNPSLIWTYPIQNLSILKSKKNRREIRLSYNILIEFYVMINNYNFILYRPYQNPSNNLFCRYLDIWTGIDEQSLPILVFISVE